MPTSSVELSNVSPHGFWLFPDGREVFLAFRDFPWFQDATVRALAAVERPSAHHLYRPQLDVDLAVESLDDLERFPLVSGARSTRRSPPAVRKRGGHASKKASARGRREVRS